jgi:CDP-paratose 2-epimerase
VSRLQRPVLVTGGAGFIGCNLADRLATEGHQVIVYDALLREGVARNLAWLADKHGPKVIAMAADVRDRRALAEAARGAEAVFHLAAQVAVTTSLADPVEDFEINLQGSINVLEAVRRAGHEAPVIFASTNKVYGDLADVELEVFEDRYRPCDPQLQARGVSERRPLSFHTPYGCSKGAADQYVLDYGRSFGLPTCVLRMSCIYGPRQMGGEDQGWVAHFLIRALAGQPINLFGDGRQVRDILDVDDAVAAYLSAWRRIGEVGGRAFNLGGGPENAVSLLQLLGHVAALTGRAPQLAFGPWRTGDQRWFVADPTAVRSALALPQPVAWRDGVARLAEWLVAERACEEAPRERAGAL